MKYKTHFCSKDSIYFYVNHFLFEYTHKPFISGTGAQAMQFHTKCVRYLCDKNSTSKLTEKNGSEEWIVSSTRFPPIRLY